MNNIICKICGKSADGFCTVGNLSCQPLCNKCIDSLYIGWRPFDEIDRDVCEFIQRRFKDDCNWTSGNCYYFAIILKDRFSQYNSELYYDVIDGHFLCKINNTFYDWRGVSNHNVDTQYIKNYIIKWNDFRDYDELQYNRIIDEVIM